MILAIDAGNSRIKWGLANEGGWQRLGAILTREVGQLDVALADLMPPEMVVISNVAGASVGSLLAQVVSRFAVPVIWTKACEQQCGISSSYALPMQLGSDRWASLIGAWNFYHSACVVVNAGTTMTVGATTEPPERVSAWPLALAIVNPPLLVTPLYLYWEFAAPTVTVRPVLARFTLVVERLFTRTPVPSMLRFEPPVPQIAV